MNTPGAACLRMQLLLRSLLLSTIFGVLVALSWAQTAGTGAISGRVTDTSGAVVVDATIKAIDRTTGETRTAVSSSTGAYLVPLLRPGV